MRLREWCRLYRIGAVLLRHGLDEYLPRQWQPWPVRLARRALFWLGNRHRHRSTSYCNLCHRRGCQGASHSNFIFRLWL